MRIYIYTLSIGDISIGHELHPYDTTRSNEDTKLQISRDFRDKHGNEYKQPEVGQYSNCRTFVALWGTFFR